MRPVLAGVCLALVLTAAWLFVDPANGGQPTDAIGALPNQLDALPSSENVPQPAKSAPSGEAIQPEASLTRDIADVGVPAEANPEQSKEVPRWTVLTGRVLDLDGSPLINARLTYELGPSHALFSLEPEQVSTNATAHFRLQVKVPVLAPGERRSLTLSLRRTGASRARCHIELPNPSPERVDDLGDLRLAFPSMIVAGTVVNESGEPLSGIHVSVQNRHRLGTGFFWVSAQDADAIAGPEGGFVLYSDEPGDQFLLTGQCAEFWCQPEEIARGTSGHKLVMRRSGSLTGTVLANDRACLSGIFLELKPRDEPDHTEPMRNVHPKRDGAFEFRELEPGIYRLLVKRSFGGELLYAMPDLVIQPGVTCVDPRLNPYDLRGKIRSLLISAVDTGGRPISKFSVYDVTIPDGWRHQPSHEGKVQLVGLPESVNLIVQARGMLRVMLNDVSSNQAVTLLSSPRVRFQVTNPAAVPENFQLKLSLLPASDGERRWNSEEDAAMSPEGVAEVGALVLGPNLIQAVLWTEYGDNTGAGIPLSLTQREFDVLDVGGVQTVHVTLPELELAKAIESLRRDK
jgi:hypothetical protein